VSWALSVPLPDGGTDGRSGTGWLHAWAGQQLSGVGEAGFLPFQICPHGHCEWKTWLVTCALSPLAGSFLVSEAQGCAVRDQDDNGIYHPGCHFSHSYVLGGHGN
jgi:hypothetical protein